VLNKIFETKMGEVRGGRRKLHNGELHVFYSSPNIVQIIKSRRMEWAVHVAHWGRIKSLQEFGRET
jgi:hypothetical protein